MRLALHQVTCLIRQHFCADTTKQLVRKQKLKLPAAVSFLLCPAMRDSDCTKGLIESDFRSSRSCDLKCWMKSSAAKRDQEREVTGEVSRHPEVWKCSLGALVAQCEPSGHLGSAGYDKISAARRRLQGRSEQKWQGAI